VSSNPLDTLEVVVSTAVFVKCAVTFVSKHSRETVARTDPVTALVERVELVNEVPNN